MNITAIFLNSPFDDEIRIDCESIKLNTTTDGEIVILPNFRKSIFEIKDTILECKNNDKIRKIQISGNGIIKFDNKNNILNCFGLFSEIKDTDK